MPVVPFEDWKLLRMRFSSGWHLVEDAFSFSHPTHSELAAIGFAGLRSSEVLLRAHDPFRCRLPAQSLTSFVCFALEEKQCVRYYLRTKCLLRHRERNRVIPHLLDAE